MSKNSQSGRREKINGGVDDRKQEGFGTIFGRPGDIESAHDDNVIANHSIEEVINNPFND